MCPPGGRRNRRGRTLAARTHHHQSWFLFRYNFFRLSASSSAFRSSPPPLRRRRSCRPCGQAQVARRCTGSRPGRRSVAQVYTYSSFYNIIIITVLYVHDVGSYVNTVIARARAHVRVVSARNRQQVTLRQRRRRRRRRSKGTDTDTAADDSHSATVYPPPAAPYGSSPARHRIWRPPSTRTTTLPQNQYPVPAEAERSGTCFAIPSFVFLTVATE